jgi:hypothetical protein
MRVEVRGRDLTLIAFGATLDAFCPHKFNHRVYVCSAEFGSGLAADCWVVDLLAA